MSSQRTYKKLGEFIEEYSVRNKSNAPIPVYSVTNDKGFCQGYFDKEVASKDKSTYKIVPRNFFAYNPSRINVGSIACQQAEDKVIVSPLYVIFGVNDEILCPYLLYFLKSPVANVYINAYARGAVRNNFSFAKMSELMLPVPSVAEQEKIVKELDAIKEIIAAKYTQIDELDNLAKAIFYDMFGDPASNPKGWDWKRIDSICENCDSKRKPVTSSDRVPGKIPYYGASGIVDYVKDYIFDGDYLLVSEDGANLLARTYPIAFPIFGKSWVNNHAHVLKFEHYATQLYVQTVLNLTDLSLILTGCIQPKFNQAKLNEFMVPLPPLDLQQAFAKKIEAIDAQKQTLRQSIAEFESLLAQRMDVHFG